MKDIRTACKIFLDFIYDEGILPRRIADIIDNPEKTDEYIKWDIRAILKILRHLDGYNPDTPTSIQRKIKENRHLLSDREMDTPVRKWLKDSEKLLSNAITSLNDFFHDVSKDMGTDTFIKSLYEMIEKSPEGYEKAEYLKRLGKEPTRTSRPLSPSKYAKANGKIPLWANKPQQLNHQLIWAYFQACVDSIDGTATIEHMKNLFISKPCGDEKQFNATYSSLKTDSANSNGKVFEDDGENVWIWDEVAKTLNDYKSYFHKG